MATRIITKNGSGAPLASDLQQGELAVDLANKRLYTEDSLGAVQEVGVNPAAEITANAGVALPDSQKATFGADDDLQIYHDGSNSFVTNSFGDLAIQASTGRISLAKSPFEFMVEANIDADVSLYYDSSKKLATTSTGIDVTGTVTADGLSVDGGNTIRLNASSGDDFLTIEQGTSDAKISANSTAGNANLQFFTTSVGSVKQRVDIATNGDISFYEDTGTTAKFFWDASAESLGIGTSSATSKLYVNSGSGDSTHAATFYANGNTNTTGYNAYGITLTGNVSNGSAEANIVYGSAGGGLAFNSWSGSGSAVERMRLDASGNVGIGINAPLAILHTKSKGPYAEAAIFENNGDATSWARTDWKNNQVSGTGIVYLDNSGTFVFRNDNSSGTARSTIIQAGNTTAGNIVFNTATSVEAARIDSSGNLLVGTSSSTSTAGRIESVVGDAVSAGFTNDSSAAYPTIVVWNKGATSPRLINFRVTGSYTSVGTIESNGTSTIYGTSSDARLKENITDANDAGDKIDAIQVRQYDWKADGSHQDYGMIAQELMTVAPEAVSGDPESDEMMGVDYSKLVPMLIKEIQSLRARVAQLETN